MQSRCILALCVLSASLLSTSLHLASGQTKSDSATTAQKAGASSQSSNQFERTAKRAAQARDQNNVEDAVALYRAALKLKPSWLEGWWDLGTILYDADRYDEARPAFHRLTNLKPDGAPAWVMLGLCEFEVRDYEQSLQHLRRAQVGTGPGNNLELKSVAQYHLAILYTRFEQYEWS